ncbi:hypothetical protein TanjilG_21042 [Lupinus angustifolius]|uniref:Sm domain-containing protein n=1 Tax=Lupinus angustifolius TaxID=3871 RepID=A0A1J7IK28_LUPAN|nr:hypothetical protein TanjilG_21042 [Lupinus angustifolius]
MTTKETVRALFLLPSTYRGSHVQHQDTQTLSPQNVSIVDIRPNLDDKIVLREMSYVGPPQSGRKETVLDLAKFVDKGVQVKLTGGRQVTGTLKGYDQLLNLVLDEAVEFIRDSLNVEPLFSYTLDECDMSMQLIKSIAFVPYVADADDPLKTTDQTRRLGLIVCRGTAVMLVSPTDGTDEIANPFLQPEGA